MDEQEVLLLDILCDKDKESVDVGAHEGMYTRHLLLHSSKVYAYEPLPSLVQGLREEFEKKGVVVSDKALSDEKAVATLYIPVHKEEASSEPEKLFGWASVEKGYGDLAAAYPQRFPSIETISVVTAKLDDEALGSVGFIKIDVEGAELKVLRGAEETLKLQHPLLLIEIEERHRPQAVESVTEYLSQFGYSGYFVQGDILRSMSEFSKETMQTGKVFPGKVAGYINNFIFLPAGNEGLIEDIRRRLQDLG